MMISSDMLCIDYRGNYEWDYLDDEYLSCVYDCRLNLFKEDFSYWRTEVSEADRNTLLRFLEGEPVLREGNRITIILPELGRPEVSDSELMDRLFLKNDKLRLEGTVFGLPVEVKVVPGSMLVQCISHDKDYFCGPSVFYSVLFHTTVRFLSTVPDLDLDRLSRPVPATICGFDESALVWGFSVLKTYLKYMDSLYADPRNNFIVAKPKTFEDMERIVVCMMEEDSPLKGHRFLWCGSLLADDPEDRRILTLGLKAFDFSSWSDHEGIMFGEGSVADQVGTQFAFGVPVASSVPMGYTRFALQECGDLERLIAVARQEGVLKGFSKKTNVLFCNIFSDSRGEDLDNALDSLQQMVDFVRAASRFEKTLVVNGDRSKASMEKLLIRRVLQLARISPMDFFDCGYDPLVMHAKFTLTGRF